MMKFRHAMAVLALCATVGTGGSCEPLVPPPDVGTGGSGGGAMVGGGGATGGGGGATGGGGGATGGGGGATGGGGGGAMGGGGGATGGGGGGVTPVQLTEYARDLIVNGTVNAAPRPGSEFLGLPDDAPITYSQGFFDGGTN